MLRYKFDLDSTLCLYIIRIASKRRDREAEIPMCAHFTACSKSASSKTSKGLFPPVSSVMFFILIEAIFMISFPVLVLPVNATLSIPRCVAIAAPASRPKPFSTLTTPAGKPASLIKVARYRMLKGVCSAALITTVFPQAKAGPSFHAAIARG